MGLNEWKYRGSTNNFIHFEDWMKFSVELARYVKKSNSLIKLYISVPSNLVFSYFFVLGAIDYDFKSPSKESLLEKYLSLQKGQRILYKQGENWVAHSVIEVSKIPNTETRAIAVQERKNCINYIPETRWFNYIRIHNDEVTQVRNTRRVRDAGHIVTNSKLRNLYSEHNLNLLMMQNTPKIHLYANKKEWKDCLSVVELKLNKETIQLDDLVFDGSNGSFKNVSFIQQNHSAFISNESTIIFVGSSRALRKMDQFRQQKCIFIVDQHDSNEKFEELQLKVEQEFLTEKGQSINREILGHMNRMQIPIPKGVEIFAWIPQG